MRGLPRRLRGRVSRRREPAEVWAYSLRLLPCQPAGLLRVVEDSLSAMHVREARNALPLCRPLTPGAGRIGSHLLPQPLNHFLLIRLRFVRVR